MQSIPSLFRAATRIMVLRGSPERIQVQTWTLPLSLALAAAAYVLAHVFYLSMSGERVAVSLFCWIMLLSAATSLLTRKVPRRRLIQVVAAMLLMLAMCGALLSLFGLLPETDVKPWLGLPVVALMLFGMSHALGFALRCHQLLALGGCLLFAASVYGLFVLLDSQLQQVFAQSDFVSQVPWIALRS